MITFLHSSDFHLEKSFASSGLGNISKTRRQDIWKTVENIIDYIIQRPVDLLLLAGDLYNEENFTKTHMNRLMSLFARIPQTKIFISPGNHDPYRKDGLWSFVNLPDNVFLFTQESFQKFEFEDYDIYGIAYQNPHFSFDEKLLNFELNESKINILLLHSDFTDSNSPYLPFSTKYFENQSFDYIATGHIHKPTKIDHRTFYPGSPEPLGFGEIGDHSVLYGEIADQVRVEKVFLSQSLFLEYIYEIEDPFNYYSLIRRLKDLSKGYEKKIYLRLVLKGPYEKSHINIEDLEQTLGDVFTYIEILDQRESPLDMEKLRSLNKDSIISVFIREMDHEEGIVAEKALELGLEALLDSGE